MLGDRAIGEGRKSKCGLGKLRIKNGYVAIEKNLLIWEGRVNIRQANFDIWTISIYDHG
jgi:hypothetical protein